jgi:hypothetical protein
MTDISTLTAEAGEPDDTQSLIRLLPYSNHFDIEGLIATHTDNRVPRRVNPQYIHAILHAYAKVRDNLARHDPQYPTAEWLEQRVKAGSEDRSAIGPGHDTEASDWIISVVGRTDPRPVWFTIWGGARELAQALWKVDQTRPPAAVKQFESKIRVYATYDQDGTGKWIEAHHPGLFYITATDTVRGMYRNGDTATAGPEWVEEHIRIGRGALGAAYPNYRGGDPWGKVRGLKEGDTPSFLYLIPNGLGEPESPELGSWGGRFEGPGPRYHGAKDTWAGETSERATVFRWREAYQNSFAARLEWCVRPYGEANHEPVAVVEGPRERTVNPGAWVSLRARGSDPDGNRLSYRWEMYPEGGGTLRAEPTAPMRATFTAPAMGTAHILLTVTDDGSPPLAAYQRVTVRVAPHPLSGPLHRGGANPNYFEDASGRPVYLTGSHTWTNFQDRAGEPTFNFEEYLGFLQKYNHNFIRLWVWEDARHAPLPYLRSGAGAALDGQPKFDLSRFDEAYFQRLRSRVILARDRGIYVSVMLFQGFSAGRMKPPRENMWLLHPFNSSNNINGIDADADRDGEGYEEHRLAVPAVTRLQEHYVRKVIDTLNDLDNLLWEIGNEMKNEPDRDTRDWQYHMIRFIQAYEAGKPQRHPVGMTCQYDWKSGNDELFDSHADWVSPGPGEQRIFRTDPPVPAKGKIVLADTDHLWGIGGDADWVWHSFTRGENPIYMDPYGGKMEVAASEEVRRNLGYTNRYAGRLDLRHVKPEPGLASSSFCLANPGREYLVYVPEAGSVMVDLADVRQRLKVEWFDPATGATRQAGNCAGGARVKFQAPFAGRAVLYLRLQQTGSR